MSRPADAAPVTGVASCPNPPLLLHGITGQPVAEVEQLRAACLAAIGELLATEPTVIVLVGGRSRAEASAAESGAVASGNDDKPLSITVGRLLLAQAGAALPIEHLIVAEDVPVDQCLALGAALRDRPAGDRIGLLVMADGSACTSVKAPGYLDERAEPYDGAIGTALAAADPDGLAALEPALGAELLVAGRAAWQVLAGACRGTRFDARMHYQDEPFGVFYPVCSWQPQG